MATRRRAKKSRRTTSKRSEPVASDVQGYMQVRWITLEEALEMFDPDDHPTVREAFRSRKRRRCSTMRAVATSVRLLD
jgi:hypothetical protein